MDIMQIILITFFLLSYCGQSGCVAVVLKLFQVTHSKNMKTMVCKGVPLQNISINDNVIYVVYV